MIGLFPLVLLGVVLPTIIIITIIIIVIIIILSPQYQTTSPLSTHNMNYSGARNLCASKDLYRKNSKGLPVKSFDTPWKIYY